MLAKLLKYEIKATSRVFLPIYGGLLILTVLMRVFLMGDMGGDLEGTAGFLVQLFSVIVAFLYGFVVFAIFALTAFVMIQRFYKNLLGDEGYLMFTLPVKPWKHILTKAIVSALWIAVSVAAMILSGCLMALTLRDVAEIFRGMPRFFEGLAQIRFNEWVGIGEMLLFLCLCLFCGILMVYASLATGQLWNRHKLGGAFLSFIGLSVVLSIALSFLVRLIYGVFDSLTVAVSFDWMLHISLITADILAAATGVGLYFLTNFMLTRRLNLD